MFIQEIVIYALIIAGLTLIGVLDWMKRKKQYDLEKKNHV